MRVNGKNYYREHRRCGKKGCRVCQESQGHGPYWYSRDDRGKVTYIGKNLPREIENEWHTYRVAAALARDLIKPLRTLQHRVDCLVRYASGMHLTSDERELVQREIGDTMRHNPDLADEILAVYLTHGDRCVEKFLRECGA